MLIFGHFSPKSFERLIQAICIHVLGPGTTIFGSGPDGGREATFTGEVPFPSLNCWNGYIVVQAKCRERLRDSIEDANWLIDQLRTEFKKFSDLKRQLRHPEFYLVATNVRLSSVPDVGGKAKVEAFLQAASTQLGIKAFHVWAADELEAILDTAPDIRRSYTAWLTPSDVLSDLVDSLKRPNLKRLLPLALTRDLRNERDVRLRDAGQETEKPIYIDSAFVDLPVRQSGELPITSLGERLEVGEEEEAEEEEEEDEEEEIDEGGREPESRYRTLNVTGRMQIRAADKLDPDFCKLQRPHGPRSNRIVLLGGPGQGKSTIGQFLCQLARARLLFASTSLNPEYEELLQPIFDRAHIEGIPLVGPCRFPVRIDLPTFADALEKSKRAEQSLTLLFHIANRLSRELDCLIDVNDLRAWLGVCPWLLVLDGLDEVPVFRKPDVVIKSIDTFWDEVHLANADVLVVVTSRPQGYQQALSQRHWEHWELAPLNVLQAKKGGYSSR